MKRVIKITESEIRKIVKRVLNEYWGPDDDIWEPIEDPIDVVTEIGAYLRGIGDDDILTVENSRFFSFDAETERGCKITSNIYDAMVNCGMEREQMEEVINYLNSVGVSDEGGLYVDVDDPETQKVLLGFFRDCNFYELDHKCPKEEIYGV